MKTTICQIEYPTVEQCLELRRLGVKIPTGTANKQKLLFAYTYLELTAEEKGWYFGVLFKNAKMRDFHFFCELGTYTIFCEKNGSLPTNSNTVLCPTLDQVIELLGNYQTTSELSKTVVQALENPKEVTCTELLTTILIETLINKQK